MTFHGCNDREELTKLICNDPAFKSFFFRYLSGMKKQGDIVEITNFDPRDVIGAQRNTALGFLRGNYRLSDAFGVSPMADHELMLITSIILRASPLFISNSVVRLIDEMAKKIKEAKTKHTTPRKLFSPAIYIHYESDITLRDAIDDKGNRLDISFGSQLLCQRDDRTGWGFAFCSDSTVKLIDENPWDLEALAIFLEQKIATVEEVSLTRQMKKATHGSLRDNSTVRVIKLRAREQSEGGDPSNPDEKADREYHHRWIVRGHLRNQYMPSTKGHKLMWIDPYIKGDVDKPMIEKVYSATR